MPGGDELAYRAGARRGVALGVVVSCARFAPVRHAGLGPDYPEYPVRAGELLAARRTRHVALACPELFQQVTGLIEPAERRGIPTRVSALLAVVHMLARPGKARFHRSAPSYVRSEVQQPRYAVRRSLWGSARPMAWRGLAGGGCMMW